MISLVREDEISIRGHLDVAVEAISFLQKLHNLEFADPYPGKEMLNQYISKTLSPNQILELNKEVSIEEIHDAFMSLHPNKVKGVAQRKRCVEANEPV